jgi:hypothetical protein
MRRVATLIGRAVRDPGEDARAEVSEAVAELVAAHPAYPRA